MRRRKKQLWNTVLYILYSMVEANRDFVQVEVQVQASVEVGSSKCEDVEALLGRDFFRGDVTRFT